MATQPGAANFSYFIIAHPQHGPQGQRLPRKQRPQQMRGQWLNRRQEQPDGGRGKAQTTNSSGSRHKQAGNTASGAADNPTPESPVAVSQHTRNVPIRLRSSLRTGTMPQCFCRLAQRIGSFSLTSRCTVPVGFPGRQASPAHKRPRPSGSGPCSGLGAPPYFRSKSKPAYTMRP